MLIVGIVIAVVVVFAIGYVSYPIGGWANVGNGNVEGCAAACANLNAKRAQVCMMRSSVAAARAAMVAAGTLFAAALATSIAAAAAVAVAAAIPIVGAVVAAALAVVAAAAAVYSNYLLGRYAAACTAYAIQSNGLADASRLEAEALKLVNDSCPPEVAMNCIAGLMVCPV
jgi:hypothetical protein